MITSEDMKRKTIEAGADICGIASVSRFEKAPKGFHPCDILPDCRSVVVFACRFPLSTLKVRTNSPYTLVRNMMVRKLDQISFRLTEELENEGVVSIPIPSADPYDYWDPQQNHGRGILSLKHSGVQAGLGGMGKNTLLMNDRFGNMMWLGAVLVTTDLEPDPVALYEVCVEKCSVCIDSCPQKALDGTTINQKLCRERSVTSTGGGGWVLSCNVCRKVCPNHNGTTSKTTE